MSFESKIAVVTGGSSGIGLGIAKELVRQGAQVVITGRDTAKLDKAVQEIGPGASGVAADVTRVADIERLFETVRRDHGRLDILVPNAGGTVPQILGSITEERFDETLATNVKGVLFTVQSALPLMQAGGSIVIIGSAASIDPPVGMGVYGAAKAAVRNLVRVWIQEIKGSGIRINVVSPGPVQTPGLDGSIPAGQADAAMAFLLDKSTVGRIGVPEDVARTVAFIASDAASYINGVELFVDGGASQV
ncbi:SDR family NAD(P)-dependent oxidoreductase [Azotobacter vinelandii]|uniref:SDR family NAD(P)-dependent oxidoreductase n=1 Tax=Azotobacter vinelandii TaxID=354 RepID=UPI000912C095|nr:SDR family oxidoreductase [Azotobacter vinelandii]SFX80497.1 NAD(P)-dependent dehydrogenase, short-chain alcohol dehydrogenase family [Azotobacter vinelandii]